jgi:lipopolysaccharide/colanic/teichoic acid biosynthesis glycosyltransferase
VSGLPRPVELAAAAWGLVVAAPLLAASAALIKRSSPGPVLFKQQRVGRDGRPFTLYKFRTMRAGAVGLGVTAGGDPRITPIGRVLRKTKLDELPELWNVVRGDLSLVGPRPEVPEYVDVGDPLWREVLRERPGLTHPVTVRLRNEEELLAGISSDRGAFYRATLLPYKLRGCVAYQHKRTWRSDLKVLLETARVVVDPSAVPPPTVKEVIRMSRDSDEWSRALGALTE